MDESVIIIVEDLTEDVFINVEEVGIKGDQGDQGIQGDAGTNGTDGIDGTDGTNGTDGADGQGVPVGGTASQVLKKIDGTDYNTEWADESGGGGGSIFRNKSYWIDPAGILAEWLGTSYTNQNPIEFNANQGNSDMLLISTLNLKRNNPFIRITKNETITKFTISGITGIQNVSRVGIIKYVANDLGGFSLKEIVLDQPLTLSTSDQTKVFTGVDFTTTELLSGETVVVLYTLSSTSTDIYPISNELETTID